MNEEFGLDDAGLSSEPPEEPMPATAVAPLDERRPNVSGDLPTVFQAAPMFRRALGGYSRFQVDTYVQWAEDELAAAARENDDILARYAALRRDLDEAREQLSHSPVGADFLRSSRRLGRRLAAAADQADALVDEAQAHRATALAKAEQVLAAAAAKAERIVTEGTARSERIVAKAEDVRARAQRVLAEAELTAENVRAEAQARLEEAWAVERRAAEEAERRRRAAADEASAIRLQAQQDGVRLLSRGREERLRADAEAAAVRERLDREAAAWRAAVTAEVEQLEHRRALLEAVLSSSQEPAADARRLRPRRSRREKAAVPAPREASLAGSPDRSAVRVWKWHVRRPHLHHTLR